MQSVTINKIMQKLPLIGVLEMYYLILSNFWSEICQTYGKIQSWKKMWQPLQPPPFPRTSMLSGFSLPLSPLTSMLSGFSYPSPPLQCWVDLVSFRPPRSTILIYHWKGGWGRYSRKCNINLIFRLYSLGNNPC